MAAIELLTQIVFLLCVVVALRLWLRNRSAPATWSAATFLLLGGFVVLGLVIDLDQEFSDDGTRLLVAALLLLPWMLFRFGEAIVGAPRWLRRTMDVVGLGAVASSWLVSSIPGPDDIATTGQNIWVAVILASWLLQALLTTGMLWLASRNQPGVTKGRLKMLSIGSLLLALSVTSSTLPASESTVAAVTQLLSMAAGVTFLLGYAPPSLLRSAWRSQDERELHVAATGLLAATSQAEIAEVLLPGLRALLGSPGIVALDGDVPIASDGEAFDLSDPRTGRAGVGSLQLAFAHSAAMPLFGAGERASIDRLSVLTSLASERVSIMQAEATARHDAELAGEALAAVNAELEAFVYSASHDLKNPIIAILGYLEVLRQDHAEALDAEARHFLERVDVNARFMQSLIRDLLELSRVGRVDVEPSPVDLGEVLREVVDEAIARHADLAVRLVAETDLPTLWASRTRVRQLFDNLVENACRYADRTDLVLTVEHLLAGSDLVLDLRDNGPGIPDGQSERIFGMFERLDPSRSEGTGMGLAICRRITESMGGSIGAVPSPAGAHLRIRLPASVMVPTAEMASLST